ncbi:MAG: hypothetical protein LBS33_06905 [Streptococcaceae bacterium]|nr:hypothetical protein [Streptococcaceae bacterium]
MALLVVAIHVGRVPIYAPLGRLAAPTFWLYSAYFFFQHQSNIKNFCLRIFKLWFAWNLLYLPLTIRQDWHYVKSGGKFLTLFLKILLQGFGVAFFPGWYLLATIYGLIFIVIALRYVNLKTIIALGIVIEVSFSVIELIKRHDFTLTDSFLRAILFLALGAYFASGNHLAAAKQSWKINLFSITLLCLILTQHFILNTNTVYGLAAIGSVLLLVLTLPLKLKLKHSYALRDLSVFIYCSHILWLSVFRYFLKIYHLNLMNGRTRLLSYFIIITSLSLIGLIIIKLKVYRPFKWLNVFF